MSTEKPTVEIPAVPEWAIELTKSVKVGFAQVDARFDTIETNVDLQGATVRDVAQRMTSLEGRQNSTDERLASNSLRVKGVSDVDLKHDAAIGLLMAKVDELAAKPDTAAVVLEELKSFKDTPTGKRILSALGGALLLAIGALTVRLESQLTKLEERPAPTSSVPAGYALVPIDGGVK